MINQDQTIYETGSKHGFVPEVGKEVEGYFSCPPSRNARWHKCVPIYCNSKESNEFAVIHHRSSLHWCDEFRPLKTEAEIRRENSVSNMINVAEIGAPLVKDICEALYDAGYIKPRGITQDDIIKALKFVDNDYFTSGFTNGVRWAEKRIKGEDK